MYRLDDGLCRYAERLAADVATTPLGRHGIRLLTVCADTAERYRGEFPDIDEWLDPDEPQRERLLAAIGGTVVAIEEPDEAHAAVAVASEVQDYVMDELSRPWPSIILDGRSVVLDAGLDADGQPGWLYQGLKHYDFGQLGR